MNHAPNRGSVRSSPHATRSHREYDRETPIDERRAAIAELVALLEASPTGRGSWRRAHELLRRALGFGATTAGPGGAKRERPRCRELRRDGQRCRARVAWDREADAPASAYCLGHGFARGERGA